MKVVCAWCNEVLSPGDDSGDHVSHGICPDCRSWFFGQRRVPLGEWLNQFDVPVMAIDAHGAAIHVNPALAAAIARGEEELTGRLVASVIECVHARGQEDCGCARHRTRCPIRDAVTATHQDGRPRRSVEVDKTLSPAGGRQLVRFTISTEKAGGIVLLMVDELRAAATTAAAAT